MNPVNSKRRRRLHARNYGVDGRRGEAVRAMPCIIAGREGHRCRTPVQACHDKARGIGGVHGDANSLFPGCAEAHLLAGARRTEQREGFEHVYMVDITKTCEVIAADLDVRLGVEPCHLCKVTSGHLDNCKSAEAIQSRREARHAG